MDVNADGRVVGLKAVGLIVLLIIIVGGKIGVLSGEIDAWPQSPAFSLNPQVLSTSVFYSGLGRGAFLAGFRRGIIVWIGKRHHRHRISIHVDGRSEEHTS